MNDFDPLNNLFPKPREEIINMQSYSAPLENRRNLLRLDFNENTLGPSPRVLEALQAIKLEHSYSLISFAVFIIVLTPAANPKKIIIIKNRIK